MGDNEILLTIKISSFEYLFNFKKSFMQDILKITTDRYIIGCENPSVPAYGGFFFYVLVVIDKEHNQQ
jgi:hypothetical protein